MVIKKASRSIHDYLSWDHEQLETILGEVQRMLEDGEAERADSTFHELEERLARHLRIEEELLLPLIEQEVAQAHTARGGHREIERTTSGLRAAMDSARVAACCEALPWLAAILATHREEEKRLPWPQGPLAGDFAARMQEA